MFLVRTDLVVSRLCKMVNDQACFAFVVHRGDPIGGILLLDVQDQQGRYILQPQRDLHTHKVSWLPVRCDEKDVGLFYDGWIERYISFDSDAWVVGLEGQDLSDAINFMHDMVRGGI